MFTEMLFTEGKIWKERKCPSTDEWIKNTHTQEYYPVIKKNKILPLMITWMKESISLSEISQIKKNKYHMMSHMWNLKNQNNQNKNRVIDMES